MPTLNLKRLSFNRPGERNSGLVVSSQTPEFNDIASRIDSNGEVSISNGNSHVAIYTLSMAFYESFIEGVDGVKGCNYGLGMNLTKFLSTGKLNKFEWSGQI